MGLVNVMKILPGAQLAVCDIEKLRAAHKTAQDFPGLDVGRAVFSVSISYLEMYRYRSILAHGENPKKLLQIRSMIFVVPEGDHQCLLTTFDVTVGLKILSMERQCRGIA